MSIFQGFDKVKQYRKTIENQNPGYKLESQWTHSDTVEFDDGDTLSDKYGDTDISSIGDGTITGAIESVSNDRGHVIEDSTGTEYTKRTNLKFLRSTITDDSTNDATIIEPQGFDEMTLAEYQALPSSKLTDNIPRYITDEGSGTGYGGGSGISFELAATLEGSATTTLDFTGKDYIYFVTTKLDNWVASGILPVDSVKDKAFGVDYGCIIDGSSHIGHYAKVLGTANNAYHLEYDFLNSDISDTSGCTTYIYLGVEGGSGGGGIGGGHTIVDENGTSLAQEPNLQFVGAKVSDDSTNNKTVVTVFEHKTKAQWEAMTPQEQADGNFIVSGLGTTGDLKNNYVSFTSGDSADVDATSWTSVQPMANTDIFSTLFNKISTMAKNVRFLYKTQVLSETTNYKVVRCGRLVTVVVYNYLGNTYLNDMPRPAGGLNATTPLFVGNTIVGSIGALTDGKIQVYADGSNGSFGTLTYITND